MNLAVASSPGGAELLAGVVIAACSAVLYDLGYILEKQALVSLPGLGPNPLSVLRAGASSPRWLVGFGAMLVGLGLQVIALTLAPVSVVQPILAGGLIGLAVVGSNVLGEKHDRRQLTALVLVLAAVVAVAVSARPGEKVAAHVSFGSFVALGAPVAVAGVALFWSGAKVRASSAAMVAFACGAGLLYGLGAVAEKAVATELVAHGDVAGAVRALATPYPWLFVVATAGGMIGFQVALQRYPASIMATFTNVASSLCALLGASVVFGETLLPGGIWSLARVLGFAAVLAAVVLMSTSSPSGRPARDTPADLPVGP